MRVRSYPTVLLIKEDKKYYVLKGNRDNDSLNYFLKEGWKQGEGKNIPKSLPWMIEDFWVAFFEIKKEIQDIFRSKGNYLAKVTLITFLIISLVITVMTVLTFRDCFKPRDELSYKEYKRKKTEQESKKLK